METILDKSARCFSISMAVFADYFVNFVVRKKVKYSLIKNSTRQRVINDSDGLGLIGAVHEVIGECQISRQGAKHDRYIHLLAMFKNVLWKRYIRLHLNRKQRILLQCNNTWHQIYIY